MGCGCKFYGQQIVNPASTNPVHTLPKPRGGNAATFVANVIEFSSTANLTITIEHKNSGDTSYSSAGSFAAISASGVYTLDVTGLKEIYRWALSLGPSPTAGDLYRINEGETWRPY